MATAKKIAEQNAKAELAGNIEAVIKRVTEQYTNQRSVGSQKDFENKLKLEIGSSMAVTNATTFANISVVNPNSTAISNYDYKEKNYTNAN
mgnify:CR=1 FL=1